MPLDPRKNFAKGTLTTGIDAVVTSLTIGSGDGVRFPDPAIDDPFNITIWNDTDYKDAADDPNREILRCTVRVGDVFTVTRAQESTTAATHNAVGKTHKISLSVTAKTLDDIEAEIAGVQSAANDAVSSQGFWNANTNSPPLVSSVGDEGDFYIVNVAGSTSLDGISSWDLTDWVVFSGGAWRKVDNSELAQVISTGNEIWVDQDFGNDGTGLPYRFDKPFLTLTAAKAASVAGDTIYVREGTYNENNLLKHLVNWHFLTGAKITYTGGDTRAIFDNTATGATGECDSKITGEGEFQCNAAGSRVLKMTDSGSSEIFLDGHSIGSNNATAKVIEITLGGALVKSKLWARNFDDDVVIGTSGYLYLTVTDYFIGAPDIEASGNCFYDVRLVGLTNLEASGNAYGYATLLTGGSVNFINLSGAAYLLLSAPLSTIQRLKCANTGGFDGVVDFIDNNNGGANYGVEVTAGTVNLQARRIHSRSSNTLAPVSVSGGTLRLRGANVTTAVVNKEAIVKSGGTLILDGCSLIPNGTGDSIEAASAQTVTSIYSVATAAVDANVTVQGQFDVQSFYA